MKSKDKVTCPAEYTQENHIKPVGNVGYLVALMLMIALVTECRLETKYQAAPGPAIPMETIKPFDLWSGSLLIASLLNPRSDINQTQTTAGGRKPAAETQENKDGESIR
mgnify:CR=1 FL=1